MCFLAILTRVGEKREEDGILLKRKETKRMIAGNKRGGEEKRAERRGVMSSAFAQPLTVLYESTVYMHGSLKTDQ